MLILYKYTICNTNIKVPVLWTQSVMKVLHILCYSVNSDTDSQFGPIVLEVSLKYCEMTFSVLPQLSCILEAHNINGISFSLQNTYPVCVLSQPFLCAFHWGNIISLILNFFYLKWGVTIRNYTHISIYSQNDRQQ